MTDYNIDFKDHIVQFPNRFKQVQVSPGVVDLVPTWIENPSEVIEEGTPVNAELFDKLRANVTRRSETFAATAGQTVFNLTKAYLVDQGRIDVYISGIKQRSDVDFTETSPTSFTLSEGLDAGTIVEAVYFSASQALSEDLIEQVQAAEAATIAASEAADDANEAAAEARSAQLNWKSPVATITALNALANPQTGDARQVTAEQKGYRYDGTQWRIISEMNLTPLTEVDNRLTSQLADIETQKADKTEVNDLAADKADKTYVDNNFASLDTKINSQASGSPKAVYATVAALTTAFPTGNSNIYLVTADSKWYYWNGSAWTAGGVYQSTGLADDSVTYRKIKRSSGVELSDDLSVGNKVPNKYVHNVTGVLTDYPNTTTGGVTGFIPVIQGEVLRYFGYTNQVGFVGWVYDSAQQPLVALTSPATANSFAEMAMPAGAAFIRVNYAYSSEASFSVKRYQEESASIAWLVVEQGNVKDDAITEEKLSPQARDKLNIPNESIGIEKLSSEVKSQIQFPNVPDRTITLDKLSQSVIDFIEEPSTPPVNPFDGDTSAFVGDSIIQGTGTTAQNNRWANIVVNQLSFSPTNYQNLGVGGSTVAKQSDGWAVKSFVQRVCDENQIASGRDRIFILGGVNDFARSTPLSTQEAALSHFTTNGTWDDFTFYGALNRLIRYIRANHNDAELVYVVPMHYELENTPNAVGLKMKSYINAIREVCEYYAVPIIDLWAELPIDPKNIGHKNKYTMNGSLTAPDGIHPNDLGNAMIANKVINYLKHEYIVR